MNFQEKPKRPPSVWIAQIFLFLFAVVFLLMQLFILVAVPIQAPVVLLVGFVMSIVMLVAFPLAAFIGMAKRKIWGRWLGIGFFSFFLIVTTLGQIIQTDGPLKRYEYTNDVQVTSAIISQIVFTGLLLFLIFRLAFGKNVSRFFAWNARDSAVEESSLSDLKQRTHQ